MDEKPLNPFDQPGEPPRSFGHQGAYRIISELGRGGSATVYRAYQEALDRHVALKILRSDIVHDESSLERFKREARAAARLGGHPNIVTIYDYGEQDGQAYLVLEFVDGTTLHQRLAETIPPAEAERIISAVASALDHAHANHLIHRDIKPANVLLGNDGRILLSDFGIAKLLDSSASLTAAATIGTPEYMSPEQIIGAPVDARSDIYSLGVMLYRIFAGRAPFQGGMFTLMHKHVNEPPPPISTTGLHVPPGVEQVIQRALQKNPADRYASAGELAADLSRALGSTASVDAAQTQMTQMATGRANVHAPIPAPVRPPQPAAPQPIEQPTRVSGTFRPPAPLTPPPMPAAPSPPVDGRPGAPDRRLAFGLVVAVAVVLLILGGVLASGVLSGATPSPTTTPPTSAPVAAGAANAATPPSTAGTSNAAMPPSTTGTSAAEAHAAHTPASTSSAPTASSPATAPGPPPAPSPAPPAAAVPVSAAPASTQSRATSPPLATARNLHTATSLEDGRILVVGGRDGTVGVATAELYDRATNSWTPAGTMATPRYRHTATSLPSGKVLVTGGQESDTGFLATAELYDPATNTWSAVQSMAVARSAHSQTVLKDGKVLVTGGYNAGKFHDTAELYDPSENSWRPVASMAAVHADHTATLLADGTVLVVGGFGSSTQATAERYDPAADRWNPAGSMAEGRVRQSATLLSNGKVLVAGGNNSTGGGTYLATAELYDPATNGWSDAAPMAGPRSGHVAILMKDDRVLLAGGRNTESALARTEAYDPLANTWTEVEALAVARWLPAAAPLPDGRILVVGGRVGNGSLATNEEFDPTANAWGSQPQFLRMEMTSQNDSGIMGTATFAEVEGGKLRIEIRATGAGAGPRPAHIHAGSCANLNPAPKIPLTSLIDGVSISEVEASLQELTSAPHAIHLHKSPDEMPIYVACADTRKPG